MKLEHIAQIQIAAHYLSAIFNADETGMSDEESEQLNAFLYPRFNGCMFEVIDESPYFAHDEVSKLAADVVRLNVYKQQPEKPKHKTQSPRMTASDLKFCHERAQPGSYFFTRKTMSFFGDTMKNYGVRAQPVQVKTYSEEEPVLCWELYRRRPVKHGLSDSAFFAVDDFRRIHPAK